MNKVLLFRIRDRQYGLDLPAVKNIQKADALFGNGQIKETDEALVLEGEEIPFMDLSTRLAFSSSIDDPLSEEGKILLLKTGEKTLAVRVDRVDGVIEVDENRIEPVPPVVKETALSWFPRVLKQGETLVLMLNPEGINKEDFQGGIMPGEDMEEYGGDGVEDMLIHTLEEKMMPDLTDRIIPGILERAVNRELVKVKKALQSQWSST